jgi:hypothetical protein
MPKGWRGAQGVWGDMARPQMAQEQEFIARAQQAPTPWALTAINKWASPRGRRGQVGGGRGGRGLISLENAHHAHGHHLHEQALPHQPFRCSRHNQPHLLLLPPPLEHLAVC